MKRTKYTQLDSRIETDNIRCFILLSGLRKLVAAKLKELSPPVQSSILSQSLASLLSSVIEA